MKIPDSAKSAKFSERKEVHMIRIGFQPPY